MQLRWGAPDDDPDFQPEAGGWRPVPLPVPAWAHAWLLVPIASAGVFLGWLALVNSVMRLSSRGAGLAQFAAPSLPALAAGVLALLAAHELLHAACHPAGGLSPKSTVGVWPARGLFYAHYSGALTRERLQLVALAPLLVLSAAPLIGWALLGGWLPAAGLSRLVFWGTLHSALCGGDVLSAFFLAVMIPPGALVQSKGDKAYWRPGAQ